MIKAAKEVVVLPNGDRVLRRKIQHTDIFSVLASTEPTPNMRHNKKEVELTKYDHRKIETS